jgi:2-desacetyl-2-hydroxyethyl bacteriochlorophyllide A dehydrogenase
LSCAGDIRLREEIIMRALVYRDSQLRFVPDAPLPQPNGDQLLLKIRQAGICNTDLEIVRGYMGFSGIPGHEFVAEVVEGASDWKGKRVVGEINAACRECDTCRRGVPSQCPHRTTVGIFNHDGAFADYMVLTVQNLYAVPESVSDSAAVFVEPLAAALQVIEAVHISPRDRVVLIGAGKLGMLVAQVLKLTGADLVVAVRRERQAKLLHQWGIRSVQRVELRDREAQVVVDCTGVPEGFADALNLVQPRGTIVLKSTYHGLPAADLTRVVVDEIRVVGSRCGPFDAALRLLENGQVDVESLIDARYPFEDALAAFEHAERAGVLKVLLEY